jgi:SAM-dependent methyltransferase
MSYGTEKESHLGGYWNVKNIWGDPGTWSPEIWNKIIKDYAIESVADIGCGLGFSTKYFSQKGLYAVGVEGGLNAINNNVHEGNLLQNDYTTSSVFDAENDNHDLIWCCEFVEHVEEKFMNFFLNDFKTGKYIAMTFAEPGQPGYHHVNCQHQEYWIEKIEALGYKFNKEYTETLRAIAYKTNNNPVFAHGGHLLRILFFEKL